MHPASVFHWSDRRELLAFVGQRAFATLVGTLDGRPVVTQVPVLVDGLEGAERLLLHVSRGNPMARALPLRVVAVVAGPDAYVSPDWYTQPDQVPTWSYVSVELEGELAATDDAMLLEILRRQSAAFEARIAGKPPWTPEAMTPAVLAAKLGGILGATLAIDALRGTRKLGQNKGAADRSAVAGELAASPRDADREIARWMRELGA